jgi:hypothetical protein
MRRSIKITAAVTGAVALVGIGGGIGSAGTAPRTVVKTVTKDVNVPGPVTTKTVTVKVPGPVQTRTMYTPVTSAAPAGATVMRFSGSGNQVTPSFPVPDSGDYVVKWNFSGNSTGYGGDDFIIEAVSPSASTFGLPGEASVSGSGSTEITGDSGTGAFNVQADEAASWTVTVTAAS